MVPRMEADGKTWKVVEFPVYGPKGFAGLERLADTVNYRCLHIELNRVTQRMPRITAQTSEQFTEIRERLDQWAT